MYILAEDTNDVECLKVLIKRLNQSIKTKGKGFGCCGNMLNKGKRELETQVKRGYSKFIICYDRDKATVSERKREITQKITKNLGIKTGDICILIPSEEMEAWILADIKAVSKVLTSWRPTENFPTPESVRNPKEKLKQLSQTKKAKPLYIYTVHNQQIFQHINLDMVKNKCPSFKVLVDFVNPPSPAQKKSKKL